MREQNANTPTSPAIHQRSFNLTGRRQVPIAASSPWRIAVVEDHLLQRTHTVDLLAAHNDLDVVFSSETLPDLLHWLSRPQRPKPPHLLILDLMVERGPNADPVVVRQLVDAGVRVLLFSAMASPPLVRKMLQAGVSGVLSKRDSEANVVAAVRAVGTGREWFSPDLAAALAHDPTPPRLSTQEERALVLYASGLTLDAVAASIGVRRDTAKKYLQRVKEKYAAVGRPVRSKVDMTRAVLVDGLGEIDAFDTRR